MEWVININEQKQYIEIATSGIADKGGSLDMAKGIALTLSSYKIKNILIDHTNIFSVSGNAIDIYSRPKQFQEIGVVHGIKVAEIVKPEHEEFFKFLEIVCVNRGYTFSIFNDKETALVWLLNT